MTKKLRLSLEALQVESFAAVANDDQRGTVAGHGHVSEGLGGTCTICGGGTCVVCGTHAGPNCDTQKQTSPCGNC